MSKDYAERISSSMIDKLCKTIDEMELYVEEVTIEDISEDMALLMKDIMADEEVRGIMREKVIETIRHINAEEAAKTVTMSWGELLGQFLNKISQAFTPQRR